MEEVAGPLGEGTNKTITGCEAFGFGQKRLTLKALK